MLRLAGSRAAAAPLALTSSPLRTLATNVDDKFVKIVEVGPR